VPRFSANLTMLFGEVPLLERFAAARRAGFLAVELVSPYEHPAAEVAAAARDAGVEVVLFNLPAGDWARGDRGTACDPARGEEFRAGVARALEYARALACPRLHAMAGVRPPGVPEERLRATYVERLRFAADALAAEGRTLLVEGINGRDMPGYYLQTSAQALSLMDEIAAPNLRYQLDAYHARTMGEDPAELLLAHHARIGHVQIADVPGRHEPGTGTIDWRALFRLLDRLGYRGFVGCEYRPLGTTEAGLGWMKEMT
jgi:hydroxypyruvate isomerase